MVLPGIGDVRTLEALSVLSGDHELVVRSVTRGRTTTGRVVTDLVGVHRDQRGEQLTTQWRRRLAPDEIARGRPGHALAFGTGNQPTWFPLAPAHAVEPWRSLQVDSRAVERSLGGPDDDAGREIGRDGSPAGRSWELGR